LFMLNVIDPLLQAKQHENKIVYTRVSFFHNCFVPINSKAKITIQRNNKNVLSKKVVAMFFIKDENNTINVFGVDIPNDNFFNSMFSDKKLKVVKKVVNKHER